MTEDNLTRSYADRRSEPREPPRKLHSVELKLPGLPIYLFKLKDISPMGACFLVKENSALLKNLHAGQKLNIRYHFEDESIQPKVFASQIKHLTKLEDGRYRDHYLVGLSILRKLTVPPSKEPSPGQ
jgi:hypothetical protein